MTKSLGTKFLSINWTFFIVTTLISLVGIAMLYSAADGSLDPWGGRQIIRYLVGCVIFFSVAVIDIKYWFRVSYIIYFFTLLSLIAVEIKGAIGMGAQRWIDLGFIQLQPSEFMKIAIVLGLARYFHKLTLEEVKHIYVLIPPLLMILVPVALVLKQPDLGTALMLMAGGGALLFVSGVRWWKFVVAGIVALSIVPIAWSSLHDYQKQRVLTFLDPSSDPLGSGYHIIQSKIAFGSGGLIGKGYLQGTQSHLNFLPEKQTDFIFTMVAEEFGLIGSLTLLILYGVLVIQCLSIALRSHSHFGRLLSIGISMTFFLYVFINMAMVMGLIPVVGVPLPLISYGGTAMLTIMFAFGLLMSAYIHRDTHIPRHASIA